MLWLFLLILQLTAISNSDFQIELRLNATPSTAFSYTSYSDNVEYDLTGTTTITGGTVVGQAYLSGKGANNLQFAQDGFNFEYQLGQTISGTSDTLTLCAKGGSNGDDICGTLKMGWFNIMANIYKNAFFDPADTANTVVYATDSLTRAIIQNIQITNTGGSSH